MTRWKRPAKRSFTCTLARPSSCGSVAARSPEMLSTPCSICTSIDFGSSPGADAGRKLERLLELALQAVELRVQVAREKREVHRQPPPKDCLQPKIGAALRFSRPLSRSLRGGAKIAWQKEKQGNTVRRLAAA